MGEGGESKDIRDKNITPINGSVNSFVADGYSPETKQVVYNHPEVF